MELNSNTSQKNLLSGKNEINESVHDEFENLGNTMIQIANF
jgi:hypothetical protein